MAESVRALIRDVPDFPKKGITFKDITPLLLDAQLFRATTDAMAAPFASERISQVVAIESRGFLLGAPIAQRLGCGLVPFRKSGKLPWKVSRAEYALEYGSDALECHQDALGAGNRVLVVDDVLATGGTAGAAIQLVESCGAQVVGCAFLIALSFLPGLAALGDRRVEAVVTF
ncbi:MAG: adenine phosphoribosyltransferase [Gemmatimonadota bacterium]|nr:adenine phosphoribosyltransferase [Gemmatimonadota bacterium]